MVTVTGRMCVDIVLYQVYDVCAKVEGQVGKRAHGGEGGQCGGCAVCEGGGGWTLYVVRK